MLIDKTKIELRRIIRETIDPIWWKDLNLSKMKKQNLIKLIKTYGRRWA